MGQQRVEVAGLGAGQPGEEVLQVVEGVVVVELRRLDKGEMDSSGLPTAHTAGEQPVLPTQGDWTQRALRCVIVERQAAVIETAGERRPLVERLAHCGYKRAFGQQLRMVGKQPGLELLQAWRAVLDPMGLSRFGCEILPLLLQGVQGPDLGESRLRKSLVAVSLSDLEELSAGMRPTANLADGWVGVELLVACIGIGN